jgi:hypothetical protein
MMYCVESMSPIIAKVTSSTNKVLIVCFKTEGRSFITNRKSKFERQDPCTTPNSVVSLPEMDKLLLLLTVTKCDLFDK